MQKAPTFHEDGKRRMLCAACGRYLGDTYLGEQKTRNVRCQGCKSINTFLPPLNGEKDGVKGILYGPNHGLFTADLTEKEIEDSI